MNARAMAAAVSVSALAVRGVGLAAIITVNDPGDAVHNPGCATTGTGTCTLRDAITYTNASGGGEINFALAGQIIRPTSALPPITQPVFLNGGLSTLVPTAQEIDGSLAGPADGLVLEANSCTLYSLWIHDFQGSGLVIRGGGTVIGGNVDCGGLRCFDHLTNVSHNAGHGIEILGGANIVRNTGMSANSGSGIYLHSGAVGNQIGSDDLGPAPFAWYPPNGIGGNGQAGIRIGDGGGDTSTRYNIILGNSIVGNGGPAIDLGGDGPTANDEGDTDDGPNALQNFPLVCSASVDPATGAALVAGNASGRPNARLTLRFFRNPPGQPNDAGTYLGKTAVDLGGAERVFFEASLPAPTNSPWPDPLGTVVATATDQEGNSSELGRPVDESSTPGLSFYTTPPCRLVDTRLPGAQALAAPRFLRPRGLCGVPATARALAVNVTVTNATGAGHLSFSAGGCPPPTSTLNFSAGQTRANDAILVLDAAGRLTVWPAVAGGGSVDVIVDVTGYWQ